MDARLAEAVETESAPSESVDPYAWMNIYPKNSGLPMAVWIGPGVGARHDARIKVMQTHGPRMQADDLAVVALRPQPHLVAGRLTRSDQDLIARWISLNEAALMDHWEGLTDGVDLARALRALEP